MNQQFVDLHVHTTASDGNDSPAQVVQAAGAAGLYALAVTDHDTLEGLPEAEAEAAIHKVELVRGCEISASLAGQDEIHILGLFLPADPVRLAPLHSVIAYMIAQRDERNRQIAQRLEELGLPVRYEQVEYMAGGNVVGRPHFAQTLLQLGLVKSIKEAFDKFLRAGALAFVPRKLPPPANVVEALATSGALVSLAHPCLGLKPGPGLESLVAELKERGLFAIEAYHSEHSSQDERYCVELANRFGLRLTGGSDYHGQPDANIKIGRGRGNLRFTRAAYEMLKEAWQATQ